MSDCCGGSGPAPQASVNLVGTQGNSGEACLQPVRRAFSQQEQAFLTSLKGVVPAPFLVGCPAGYDTDIRLLGMAALALSDFNAMPPCSGYNFNSLSPCDYGIITMGTNYYIAAFKQMEFSLVDISYNDNGLSITLDRVGQLNTVLANLEKIWLRVLENRKKCMLLGVGGMGVGTPRYSSNLSRFIGMLGNGAYGWNIP